jgi:glutamate-ammonia-ligase adenylyltransferase
MTRARCVLGPASLQQRFDTVRDNVIRTPRDASALRLEIEAMRAKVRSAHADKNGLFDVKHSLGGMVDIEFAVQYLLLAHGQYHAELLPNVGNIALLQRAQACGLLPAPVGEDAAQAYRQLRLLQHRARLNEEPPQVEPDTVVNERGAGLALWSAVFATASD